MAQDSSEIEGGNPILPLDHPYKYEPPPEYTPEPIFVVDSNGDRVVDSNGNFVISGYE